MPGAPAWPALPYEKWRPTRDTLHAHTQLLGKISVALAPAEPPPQHAALRLTGRGWETKPLPAPDGSGALVAVLDLDDHHAKIEHSDGRRHSISLTPDRSVGEAPRDLLPAMRELVERVAIDPRPQETPWSTPLDEDSEHATYEPDQVRAYFT